jgi:hypothetical protein
LGRMAMTTWLRQFPSFFRDIPCVTTKITWGEASPSSCQCSQRFCRPIQGLVCEQKALVRANIFTNLTRDSSSPNGWQLLPHSGSGLPWCCRQVGAADDILMVHQDLVLCRLSCKHIQSAPAQ